MILAVATFFCVRNWTSNLLDFFFGNGDVFSLIGSTLLLIFVVLTFLPRLRQLALVVVGYTAVLYVIVGVFTPYGDILSIIISMVCGFITFVAITLVVRDISGHMPISRTTRLILVIL